MPQASCLVNKVAIKFEAFFLFWFFFPKFALGGEKNVGLASCYWVT